MLTKLGAVLTDFIASDDRLFARVCDALPQCVARVRNGRLEWVNDATWRQDGAACRDELIGERVNDRWPTYDWERRHRGVLASGVPDVFITAAETTGRRHLWIRDTVVPVGDGSVLAIADDMTTVVQHLVSVVFAQAQGVTRATRPAKNTPLTARDVAVGETLVSAAGNIVTVAGVLGLFPGEVLDSMMRCIAWSTP